MTTSHTLADEGVLDLGQLLEERVVKRHVPRDPMAFLRGAGAGSQISLDLAGDTPQLLVPKAGAPGETKGVVYTKEWVVDLILDLVGYRPERDLTQLVVVEPSIGEGAFLVKMTRRLLDSAAHHGQKPTVASTAILAHELDSGAAETAVDAVIAVMRSRGISLNAARKLAEGWITTGDYLLNAPNEPRADIVVGNPPYIRYDDLPSALLAEYQRLYPTMSGRCDIYVGFIEAGLRQLKPDGLLSFICADRWMRAAYGANLRALITHRYAVDAVIEMHNARAFEEDVSAYPATIVLRNGTQGSVLTASAGTAAGTIPLGAPTLADAVAELGDNDKSDVAGFSAARLAHWFKGANPWPQLEPHKIEVLQHLEANFAPLQDPETGTKIGIGIATGADQVYVTKTAPDVEADRLLPLAMAADTRTGAVEWSGHYLINPWESDGSLVDLKRYPKLAAYFAKHRHALVGRNIAKRDSSSWHRTIDKVNHELTAQSKLYFPDMKLVSNPTLDRGGTYPHHNVYFLTSTGWDLEILGGLLLSRVTQLFIEAYSAKMRGGTLRFQAQNLRRICVPAPSDIDAETGEQLRCAFIQRDHNLATRAALRAFNIERQAELFGC